MSEKEIFFHLFEVTKFSEDTGGIVSACLVRDGEIIAEGFSTNEGIHAEYAVLQDSDKRGVKINQDDILYTTVIPCGRRTPGGQGEKYGDCTSNIIKSGIQHVVYAADDHDASHNVSDRLQKAGVILKQAEDTFIRNMARNIFNDSVSNVKDLI